MIVKTTAEMKALDRSAIEGRGIPSLQLMETAAHHVTDAVLAERADKTLPVLVFCGPGNNGGDGFACARQLLEAETSAKVCFVGDASKMTPDAKEECRRFTAAGGLVLPFCDFAAEPCSCAVDALFGVGLAREVRGAFAEAVRVINGLNAPVIACDIPSGINGDTGEVMGTAVKAKKTVTFTCAKPGLLAGDGAVYAGELVIADIGIPQELILSPKA